MSGRLRLRVAVILFVVLLCAVCIHTFGITRGLDLRGGVRLVLQVMTDEAVRAETDRTIQSLGTEAQARRTTENQFSVSGIDDRTLADRFPDWTSRLIDATSQTYQVQLKPAAEELIRAQAVDQAMLVIDKRLNGLGVGEMSIQRYGDRHDRQLLVQWPGFEDTNRVITVIQAPAVLELKLVEAGPFRDLDSAKANYGSSVPAHIELLPHNDGQYYAINKLASISGPYLRNAYRARDENGKPAVGFSFNAEGGRRFGQLTGQNIGRSLAVVLDHHVQSVARIETRITDSGVIRGGGAGFSVKEVDDLVVVLKSGELVAPVHSTQEEQVGASLGADSIRKGFTAAIAALTIVIAFMLLYYRWAGANAMIAMCLNLLILLGLMAYFHATLTLPGIAGIILTIGVGIDSNVLIFERIREEIRAGKPAASAIATSFRRVFITLVDTHLAALISAAVLFVFGTGAVKGFAVTLAIGLASNMFTSVFVSKTLFDWSTSRQPGAASISI